MMTDMLCSSNEPRSQILESLNSFVESHASCAIGKITSPLLLSSPLCHGYILCRSQRHLGHSFPANPERSQYSLIFQVS
jgi:hypothetical protein